MKTVYPVIIVGAGPVGLAAAAHLLQRDKEFIVLEVGCQVGDSIAEWGHVAMFSSWTLNTDPVAIELLGRHGWQPVDPTIFPTGNELINHYLAPLAALPELKPRIRLNRKVRVIARQVGKAASNRETAPFVLDVINTEKRTVEQYFASAVIDASGTWKTPSPMGGYGFEIDGEQSEQIAHGIPDVIGTDKAIYSGKDTVVIGGGHSAIAVINDLVKLKHQTQSGNITWVVRSKAGDFTAKACKPSILPGRGELESGARSLYEQDQIKLVDAFFTQRISRLGSTERLLIQGIRNGQKSMVEADRVVVVTGCRPDIEMTRELQLQYDHLFECTPALSSLIQSAAARGEAIPEPHGYKVLQHPEPNFFTIGMKSYGRAQNFFLMSGYEQVRSVCAYICGDIEAAKKIEFAYPEDGVCGGACAEGSCCGPATGEKTGSACGSGGCCG